MTGAGAACAAGRSISGHPGADRAEPSLPFSSSLAQAHPDVVHAKVDTGTERELAAAVEIRSIPTTMAFRDGVLVYSQPGALPPPVLEDLIAQVKSLDMARVRAEIAARKASAKA
jgi:thioredoxin reductase (NADPH)